MRSIKSILQGRYPNNSTAASHYENILEEYRRSGFAPPHLIAELAKEDGKYWAHVWEAILYHHFKTLGFTFIGGKVTKSGQNGPDFGIIYSGTKIWIEAIVPAPTGIPPECLEPPSSDMTTIKAIRVPHEEKLLRWTAAIKAKKEKFNEYIRDGVISENDCTVIAVNSCRLQDFAFDDLGISQLPYAVEATLPIGPLAIPLNRQGQQDGSSQNLWRTSVFKKNAAEVRTDNFLSMEYRPISAVLGAHQRDLWSGHLHFSLVHNPQARNPLHRQIMGATKEFVCELGHDEITLHNLST